MDEVPGEVRPLAVVLHEILQEGDDMEARPKIFENVHKNILKSKKYLAPPEVCVFLRQVCLDGAEVVVVGEAVEVDEHLDAVALVNEARHEVLPRQLLVGFQLDPRGLQRISLV